MFFALLLSPLCQECSKTVWSPPPLPASLVRQWWQVRRQGTGIVGNRPQKWIGVALTTQASLIRGSSLQNRCQGLKLPLGYPGTPIRIFYPIGQQGQHIIQWTGVCQSFRNRYWFMTQMQIKVEKALKNTKQYFHNSCYVLTINPNWSQNSIQSSSDFKIRCIALQESTLFLCGEK